MFSGIVERMAALVSVQPEGTAKRFQFRAEFSEAIRIEESISHNGVCLTVTKIHSNFPEVCEYEVVAVEETLLKTHLGKLAANDRVNVERSMRMNDRLDGHIVQGHVDTTTEVLSVTQRDGSWNFTFALPLEFAHLVVTKGSICINGTSLTVVDCDEREFSVTIIPYTYEFTNFHLLKAGDVANLEFDILGKYFARWMALRLATHGSGTSTGNI